ncbi:exodeoxyribonuclease VII large subunit [bacterium]|nr:exodeoxyribonuclease VII large subunit [bacterium]
MQEEINFQRKEERVFTVSEFITFLNKILTPQKAVVRGEIGRISHRGSYTFFPLRDRANKSVLNCFVWQSKLNMLNLELEEGQEVKVLGFPEIFSRTGNFNLQVERIALVGKGALKEAFEALKRKLSLAGYFLPERKKPIPRFCRRIGLITSSFADAKTDFLEHLGHFGFDIYFYDSRVEGLWAIDEIVEAIRWFNEQLPNIDVLVLTRGGGSWESLQAFNSEAVAKAIFASKIPVISGVGHEADETIADFVADRRASTPTHAARILSDPWKIAKEQILKFRDNIISSLAKSKKDFYNRLLAFSMQNNSLFEQALKNRQKETHQMFLDLSQSTEHWLKDIRNYLSQFEEKLLLSSPELRLQQGYTITFDSKGNVIKDIGRVEIGDVIETRFYQGRSLSKIKEIRKNK